MPRAWGVWDIVLRLGGLSVAPSVGRPRLCLKTIPSARVCATHQTKADKALAQSGIGVEASPDKITADAYRAVRDVFRYPRSRVIGCKPANPDGITVQKPPSRPEGEAAMRDVVHGGRPRPGGISWIRSHVELHSGGETQHRAVAGVVIHLAFLTGAGDQPCDLVVVLAGFRLVERIHAPFTNRFTAARPS